MRILITGDIHTHLFGQYAANKSNTKNSRFKAIMDVLDQIYKYAKTNKITKIFINGDIFETKNIVESFVNNSFWDWCVKCSYSDIELFLNTGNHDISSLGNEQITLLHPYEDIKNVHVINQHTILNAFDYFDGMANIVVIPFRRNAKECAAAIQKCMYEIKDNPTTYKKQSDPANLLLWHGSVMGARLKHIEYRDEKTSLFVDDLQPKFFDFVFLSHFHIRQKLADNVMYVGSPLHHDLGDAGIDEGATRGFYDVDLRNFKLIFVPTKYPAFHDIVIKDRKDLEQIKMLDTYNYYKIKILTPDVKEHEVKFDTPNINVVFDTENKTVTRIDDIKVDTDINHVLSEYVKLKNNGLDTERLLNLGKKYVKGARL